MELENGENYNGDLSEGVFLVEAISDGWQTQPMIKLAFKCQMMMAT